jgi:hypothetical protein
MQDNVLTLASVFHPPVSITGTKALAYFKSHGIKCSGRSAERSGIGPLSLASVICVWSDGIFIDRGGRGWSYRS